MKLGLPERYGATITYSCRKYWNISNNKAIILDLNKERPIKNRFNDLSAAYFR